MTLQELMADPHKIPWLVYEATLWLEPHVYDKEIFEYSTGGSTLFWAPRCKNCLSIEHEPRWAQRIGEQLKHHKNTKIQTITNPEAYIKALDRPYDIILVDGIKRQACLARLTPYLKPGGLLVLDNSERPEYAEAQKPFKRWPRISFYGPGPHITYYWETTVWRKPS